MLGTLLFASYVAVVDAALLLRQGRHSMRPEETPQAAPTDIQAVMMAAGVVACPKAQRIIFEQRCARAAEVAAKKNGVRLVFMWQSGSSERNTIRRKSYYGSSYVCYHEPKLNTWQKAWHPPLGKRIGNPTSPSQCKNMCIDSGAETCAYTFDGCYSAKNKELKFIPVNQYSKCDQTELMLRKPLLKITIISARGLRNAEGWASRRRMGYLARSGNPWNTLRSEGASDPFVYCWTKRHSILDFKTPVLRHTLNPVWNFTHMLENFDLENSLHFELWDEDDEDPKSVEPPGFLGRVDLKPSMFYPEGFEGKLAIDKRDHDELSLGDGISSGRSRYGADPPTLSVRIEVITTTTTTIVVTAPGPWFMCRQVNNGVNQVSIEFSPEERIIMTKTTSKTLRGKNITHAKKFHGTWSHHGGVMELVWHHHLAMKLQSPDGGRTFFAWSSKADPAQQYKCTKPPFSLKVERENDKLTKSDRLTDYALFGCLQVKKHMTNPLVASFGMNLGRCFAHCTQTKGYRYFAVTRGDTCYCLTSLPATSEDPQSPSSLDQCSIKCSGRPSEQCGGLEKFANVYTMIDCDKTSEELEQMRKSKYAALHGFYLARHSESCGQGETTTVRIDGSTTLVGSPEACKEACWMGYGAKTCHGFTYDEHKSKCIFHWDVLSGKPLKGRQFTCYFKKNRPFPDYGNRI